MRKALAYSLIELLVVMAIISFLIIGAWGVISYANKKSRDHKRVDFVIRDYNGTETSNMKNGVSYAAKWRSYVSHHGYSHCVDHLIVNGHNICLLHVSALSSFHMDSYSHGTYVDIDSQYPTYAICILLETKHVDGERVGYYSAPPSASSDPNTKGCYCEGAARDYARCYGLTHASGGWGSFSQLTHWEGNQYR